MSKGANRWTLQLNSCSPMRPQQVQRCSTLQQRKEIEML